MSRDRTRRYNNWDDDDEQQGVYDDEQEYFDEPPRRRRPPAARPRRRRRKQRRVWPWLLAGCAGGIIILVLAAAIVVFLALRAATNGGNLGSIGGIANPTTYTHSSSQTLPLTNITQVNIHDLIGNITITVDPNATQSTVTAVTKVKATSSDDANKEFGNVALQVQPPGTPTGTLAVSATVPDVGGILGNHNDSVDLTITLSPGAIAQASSTSTPLTLAADTSIGDVTVNGLNGVLGIKDDVGTITVNNATLFDGSHLATGTGNVLFNGSLNLTPAIGNTTPRYKLQCESGQLDVTLPPGTNVILDANTNAGTITSAFPINVQSSGGAANFYGPLLSGSTQGSPLAVLTLNVSTGQVTIHEG